MLWNVFGQPSHSPSLPFVCGPGYKPRGHVKIDGEGLFRRAFCVLLFFSLLMTAPYSIFKVTNCVYGLSMSCV